MEIRKLELPPESPKLEILRSELESSQATSPVLYPSTIHQQGKRDTSMQLYSTSLSKPATVTGKLEVRWVKIRKKIYFHVVTGFSSTWIVRESRWN